MVMGTRQPLSLPRASGTQQQYSQGIPLQENLTRGPTLETSQEQSWYSTSSTTQDHGVPTDDSIEVACDSGDHRPRRISKDASFDHNRRGRPQRTIEHGSERSISSSLVQLQRPTRTFAYNQDEHNRDLQQERNQGVDEASPGGQEAQSRQKSHQLLKREEVEPNRDEDEALDLTELAAPAPVEEDSSGKWRKQSDLESKRRRPFSSTSELDKRSGAATQLYIVSYLIFFSFLGTLARLGVQWLTFYRGAPIVVDNIWANFGGTLFMGFLTEDRKLFKEEWGARSFQKVQPDGISAKHLGDHGDRGNPERRAAHSKVKKTIPLFIGLATGFCGSFTSFSTFMRDAFYALANGLPSPLNHPAAVANDSVNSTVPRNNAYSLAAVLAVWILTVTVSMGALTVGAHIAVGLDKVTPTLPFKFVRRFMDPLFVFLAFGCWLGAIFMSIWPPDRDTRPTHHRFPMTERWRGEVLFALVFSPIGCLLRFYLSLKLNGLLPSFPLGTFAANMFGTAVLCMSYDFQHVSLSSSPQLVGGGIVGCQVLQGIEDGFCGCLTTVSTWILELSTLRRRHAYLYGIASIFAGLALTVVILGSVRWSVGFSATACITSNS